jgi:L-fucose isomerase-like protein
LSKKKTSEVKIGFVPAHREPFDENWAVEMRSRCLKTFSKIKGLKAIVPEKETVNGLVRDDADAEKTIKLFKEASIDGIIIGTMTFGDEVSALAIASAFSDKPILLFGTKEGPFKPDGGRRSDSFCGTLSVSSGLHRRNIKFLFAGIVFPEEKEFLQDVSDFVRVCSIVKGFIGAQVGLVGPRPERFETCIFSEDAMIKAFKQRLVPLSLADIIHQANLLDDNAAKVQKVTQEMKKEIALSGTSEKTIKKLAKLELTLEKFAEEKSLSGMGVQCWTAMQQVYGVSPCYCMGRLTDRGIMCSCEVDIYGSLTMLIQHLASMKATPPHFIDWTIKHQEKENVFLSWHCGNAPPSLVCQGCLATLQSHSILGEMLGLEKSVGTAEFQLKPGLVTICRLVEYNGQFKMLVTKGKVETADQNLRGSWCWVKVQSLDNLYRTLVEKGFIHHASIIHGDYVKPIVDACKFLGIETVTV